SPREAFLDASRRPSYTPRQHPRERSTWQRSTRILRHAFAGETMTMRRILVFMFFVVAGGFSPTASAQMSDLDPRIVKLVASVSEDRLGAILKKLESFETRNSLSS